MSTTTKCRHCNATVAKTANFCPQCGGKNPANKWMDTSLSGNAASCITAPLAIIVTFALVSWIVSC